MRILSYVLMWFAIFGVAAAAQPVVTVAVEDTDYSPYYTWEGDTLSGPCGEIVSAVFETMGYEVEFVHAPWSRVLRLVELKDVDAALCATKLEERLAYSIFPDKSLLSYDATLFVLNESEITSSDEQGLVGLSFGVVSAYSFAGVELRLEEIGMFRQDAQSRESLLQVLLAGRVDAVLDTRLPLISDAQGLGVDDRIRALEPSLMQTPAYLMFSKRDSAEDLVNAFSSALATFRDTEAYQAIAERYGMAE